MWSKSITSTDERRRNWQKKIEEIQNIKGKSQMRVRTRDGKELWKKVDWFEAWLSDSTIADDVKIVMEIAACKRVDARVQPWQHFVF
jgi:hypothetical protein